MLDDLVSVIETLKDRIQSHREALQANETRTRMVLIDPLLQALGWDTADLRLVRPEYEVSSKRSDYALLGGDGAPVFFLEAKRLDEPLANHRSQVVAYASELGIRYPALTNGNQWEVYDNSKLVPIEQRRILEVSIANNPAHQTALQLLLLWRPNLSSSEPLQASEPILTAPTQPLPPPKVPEPPIQPNPKAASGSGPSAVGAEHVPLSEFVAATGAKVPPYIRFPDGTQRSNAAWRHIPEHTAEWLWQRGFLTTDNVPVASSGRRYIVNTTPQHPQGNAFNQPGKVPRTELFSERNIDAKAATANAKKLLDHCQQDASQVYLRLGD